MKYSAPLAAAGAALLIAALAGCSPSPETTTVAAPSGTITKGASAEGQELPGGASCGSTCSFLHLDTTTLAAGSYTVTCWTNRGGADKAYATFDDVKLAPPGADLPCFYGYPGTEVWAEIKGQFTTAPATW